MSEVKKYDHGVFHRPGDEGSESSAQGETYAGADCPNEAAPLGGSHEVVHRPGNEGSELGPSSPMAPVTMGYQNVPPGENALSMHLQGPEVRRTYVPPATEDGTASDAPGMPGAN
jgi:hypothetical protein